ncbi:hypothetical protein VTN31DRAFT_5211 [Thermomyces dupontii]|uniref:uncharacterized protein n=1 Tax=Talaromyces thermophilus TaxID=28565 RepID=UPI003743914B
MGRAQSLNPPYPINTRTSSVRATSDALPQKMASASKSTRKPQGSVNNGSSSVPDGSGEARQDLLLPHSAGTGHDLRVRASSPVLGQTYRAQQQTEAASHPLPSEAHQLRKSGSWSNLASQVKDMQSLDFETQSQRNLAFSDIEGLRGIGFPPKQPQQPTQQRESSKRKTRPSRIDLSLLFPKPRSSVAPLLSPQRYTDSPSPVPSDASLGRSKKPENKLTKPNPDAKNNPPGQPDANFKIHRSKPPKSNSSRPVDWFDMPIEKTIRCDDPLLDAEIDEEETEEHSSVPSAGLQYRRPSLSQSRQHSRSRSPGEAASHRLSSSSLATRNTNTNRTSDTHISPRPIVPVSSRIQNSLQAWQSASEPRTKLRNSKGRMSKKTSSNTLMTTDLNQSSVLSLSSSEDEGEDDDEEVTTDQHDDDDEALGEELVSQAPPKTIFRDSIATYGELEAEICTAKAVVATKGPAITHVDRKFSFNSGHSAPDSISQPRQRNRNTSLSTYSASRRESRASTNFAISEPGDFHENLVPVRQSLIEPNVPGNRRSRVMAVTREEESFLEALRRRNGRITPGMWQEIQRASTATDTGDTTPVSPRTQRDSVMQNSNTSFLRLSANLSSTVTAISKQGAPSKDQRALSMDTASDSEQKTDEPTNGASSVSLVYSDAPSSLSTVGNGSPLTPTLPIHRFSPPTQPPSCPPPPVPRSVEASRHPPRHSHGDAEAIMLGQAGNPKNSKPDYPLWSARVNSLAIVH